MQNRNELNFKRWKEKHLLDERAVLEDYGNAFDGDLAFGTAGLRGIMGPGTNRMNVHVIRRVTQGVAAYLLDNCDAPKVVISYDSRNHSREFAEETAAVLAANGVKAFLFPEIQPVPVLSYAVRALGCDAGIMITASHNPREYNGYKVYAATGGQILDEEAGEITKYIADVDLFDDVKTVNFHEALDMGCSYVEPHLLDAYRREVHGASDVSVEEFAGDVAGLKIVYTPLNGAGAKLVPAVLQESGFHQVTVVAEQELPDGDFPTCPSPNPEKEEVYGMARDYAERVGADVIVATDPDCDRAGVMERYADGWRLLSGNEIGTLMLQYLCHVKPADEMAGKTVVTSLVSTPIVDRIAEKYGVNVTRTLVGFKYIGEQMDLLGERFLLGFEESNGYLMGTYTRDKDGVLAAKMICQMAAYYQAQGKTLADVLESIACEYGYCLDETISREVEDMGQVDIMLSRLAVREQAAAYFDDVKTHVNYLVEETGLPKAKMVQVAGDDYRVIVRPSGTEPKVKLYVSAFSERLEAGMVKLEKLKNILRNL